MRYNINNNNLSKIFFKIERQLEKSQKTINELLNIDYKYSKTKIDLEKLKNTLEMLKKEKIDMQKEQTVLIKYNGNPVITLNLSIIAILTKSIIMLEFNQNMIGINTFIIETINNILGELQTDNLVKISTNKVQDVDQIICIDDINTYNSYLREKNHKSRFYSFDYLDFYSDSDEFEEIEELIYKYAEKNQIPIENYSELDAKQAAEMMASGLGKNVVILTKNEQTRKIFETTIKDKLIYINKNPFEKNIRLINKEIILI